MIKQCEQPRQRGINHLHTFIADRRLERLQIARASRKYQKKTGKPLLLTITGTDTIEHSKRVSMRDIMKQYGIKG